MMIDKKVYKTDYKSEFSEFLDEISSKEEPKSVAMEAEVKKYTKINKLRDNQIKGETRNKIWDNF